ncbi:hypothetical protein [Streptomyces sp. NPDC001508]|uniref:hypothetical protein n=1 Tax=Streptomyces sp. NPDC001508 TaxID=3154656 RepID=UPI00331976F9
MSHGINDTDDVVGLITQQIEQRFGMSLSDLKSAVAAAPDANPEATDVVRWHELLNESQAALDRAEEALIAALQKQPAETDELLTGLTDRVKDAVTGRDNRAQALLWQLDPQARGKQDLATERRARQASAARRGPAVTTSPPVRPAVTSTASPRGAAR